MGRLDRTVPDARRASIPPREWANNSPVEHVADVSIRYSLSSGDLFHINTISLLKMGLGLHSLEKGLVGQPHRRRPSDSRKPFSHNGVSIYRSRAYGALVNAV